MASFDFITEEGFRTALENDFREMNLCINSGAYKAAVVLAGSIIESVLIDYVISEKIVTRDEALKIDFGKVISLCKDKKIISEKTSDLSSAVKGYRNLIHPGRAIRLNEIVSKDSADVAKALVGIVLGDVEKQKKENYGYTAQQIVSKIRNDSNVVAILPLLIKKTNPVELERLMFRYLPEAYTKDFTFDDYADMPAEHIQPAMILCFRLAFDAVDEKTKKKVATWFARIRSEESDPVIEGYGTAFIKASDMHYMNKDDADLVKHHMLGRLSNNMGSLVLDALFGIGEFIEVSDVQKFVDPLVRFVTQKSVMPIWIEKVVSLFEIRSSNFSPEVKEAIISRLDQWINSFQERNQDNWAEKIKTIKYSLEEFPF